jgi:hypothetical protein
MISVHDRVDAILKHIDPTWLVVDLGCGDQYLKKCHPNTINVDRVNNAGVNYICDLDWEYPEIKADCAVMSGLLEWLVYPTMFLRWALKQFPRIYFSYANVKGDLNWQYATTVDDILYDIKKLGREYTTEIWQGQVLFFVKPTVPSASPT